jgi:subtilisin
MKQQFIVTAKKLNVRRAPVANFSVNNIIGTVSKGMVLELQEVTDVPLPSLCKWYTDGNGQYYSGVGLFEQSIAIQQPPAAALQGIIPTDAASVAVFKQVAVYPDKLINLNSLIAKLPSNILQQAGEDIKVAVLDTGIEKTHIDLATNLKVSQDFTNAAVKDNDIIGHRTAMSSIIAAKSFESNKGITVIAYNAKLYSYKVMFDENPANVYDVLNQGLLQANKDGCQVVSMSIGFMDGNQVVEQTLSQLTNTIFVAATQQQSGNLPNELLQFPANASNVIAVAALDESYVQQYWNQLPSPLIIVPTALINGCSIKDKHYYKTEKGTSAATAIMSGIISLVLANKPSLPKNKQAILQELSQYASTVEEAFSSTNQIHFIIKNNNNP